MPACPLITTTTYSGRRNSKLVDQRNDPIQIRRSVCRRTDTVIQPPPHPPFPILHPVLWLTESDRRPFSTEFRSSSAVQDQCCFTSTETVKTIRDGEPRTATSAFSQLLSTASSHADAQPTLKLSVKSWAVRFA